MSKYVGMFPIPKKKTKHRGHESNERITEYIPCDICKKASTSTHEWFFDGSSESRNYCRDMGYQYHLCDYHHSKFHNDEKFNKKHQAARRKEIMAKNGWFTTEQWIANTPFNKAHDGSTKSDLKFYKK